MTRKSIPFEFVFDHLMPLEVTVKPMFGLWAVYLAEKIVLVLRQRRDFPETNGIWVATGRQHHESLRSEFPSLCSIANYAAGFKETEWQVLPVGAEDFEYCAIKVCELIRQGDQRIGRIPKKKR